MSTQSSSGRSASKVVHAAGGVLWRPGHRESAAEIAVIHRPRYDDWSLPKGKVDPGETEPVTAVREVLEETGHHVHLGRRIATVSYPIEQRTKKVQYWSARSVGGSFAPNNEVDDLVWLAAPAAIKKAKQPADTQSVLIVRHGTAGSKSRFSGDDKIRPLDKKGRAQAEALVLQLSTFGPTDVYAADRVRCHQTVEPLAEELGVAICNEPTPVICTQGKVIPDLIAWWCERDGIRPDKSRNRKGSTWVLSLADGHLIAADHIGSALAINVLT